MIRVRSYQRWLLLVALCVTGVLVMGRLWVWRGRLQEAFVQSVGDRAMLRGQLDELAELGKLTGEQQAFLDVMRSELMFPEKDARSLSAAEIVSTMARMQVLAYAAGRDVPDDDAFAVRHPIPLQEETASI